ncbi:MAG TPA: cohesin domain-containing protein, partial [bacterium]|nr:cohesin domain-containing protein [bacterium]
MGTVSKCFTVFALWILIAGFIPGNAAEPDAPLAGFLTASDVSGCQSDTVTVSILMDNPDNGVDAFTFDLAYDPSALAYNSCTEGTLVPPGGWVYIDCFDNGGYVTAAAFSVIGDVIPAGSSGVILEMTFTVTCAACLQNDTFPLTLSNLADDVTGFTPINGIFTYFCAPTPTPTYTSIPFTPTPTQTPIPTDTPTNVPTNTPTNTP